MSLLKLYHNSSNISRVVVAIRLLVVHFHLLCWCESERPKLTPYLVVFALMLIIWYVDAHDYRCSAHFLQCVQEAVNKHLTKLANCDPSLRVGLVTFADDVSFHTCFEFVGKVSRQKVVRN